MESLVLTELKEAIRLQNFGYKSLSALTGISPSRLKRSLNSYSSQSLTLADLEKICSVLGIDLLLLKQSTNLHTEVLKLNAAEQKLIAHLIKSITQK